MFKGVKNIIMYGVGFEPTKLSLPELESGPLDQLGHPYIIIF